MENRIYSQCLGASLKFLLAACFLMQMLTGIVGITVPIYAANMGAYPLLLGVIGATGGLIYSFMPLASGILSDKIKRKRFILASTLLYSASCALYVLAENPQILIPIKALEWVSVAIFWPSTEALLTEISGNNLEENLRKFNLTWSSATIIGPIIGGSLISILGTKTPFILSSAISLALALLAITTIKEPIKSKLSQKHKENKSNKNYSNSTAMAIVAIILFSFIGGIIFNLFPAHATSLSIPAYEIGLIMLAHGLFRLVSFSEAYKIEAKIGKVSTLLVGSLTLATASAITAISSTTVMFALAFAIFGFGTGLLYAASIAHILRSKETAKGYSAGLFESFMGLGNLLGSSIGGLASEYASLNTPYIIVLFISLAVSLYQSQYLIKTKRK